LIIWKKKRTKSDKESPLPDVPSKPSKNTTNRGHKSKGGTIELQNLTEIKNVKVGVKLGAGNFGTIFSLK
jgi:hypothetical protein